jgi:predicted lipoprotein with Yx(FWY)xxD motif
VKTRHGKLGTFLVGTNGRTLYLFEKDKKSGDTKGRARRSRTTDAQAAIAPDRGWGS